MAAQVRRNDARSRYEVLLDGEVVGSQSFHDLDGRLVLDVTGVDTAFAGRGFAALLTQHSLDDARLAGRLVVPLCPYVRAWIVRNPEYGDLVDEDMLAAIERGD